MNWLKAIGYGIVLFALLFVIGSIVMFAGVKTGTPLFGILMILAAIILVTALAKMYKIASLNQGIQVGLVWLIVDALLEYLIIVQLINKGDLSALYSSWTIWFGYALILAIPALVGQFKKA
ncbi:hypothetical protein AMJ44_10785 [candidate division WOR-1 bacterium DG_54_3]|uniref:Uncharacterized protein n=1 Tax=candidate division WOR-1 bacterium DG_54_3 TaxID=1703775 RepID=A0A0S7XSZ1_UNCSA|nr:MAG: hypothetical protein AMJ44_10785 [candidate division WOR-1 bacterium DG_54_3]